MDTIIYGISFVSYLTGANRLAVVMYEDRDEAVEAARAMEDSAEAEVVEFHLTRKDKS